MSFATAPIRLVVVSMMCAAFAAVPAATGAAALCLPGSGQSLAEAATAGFAGRGSVAREPNLGQTSEDLPASAKGRAGARFASTVPVWVHVVTDGALGQVTNTQISDQIAVLNKTFGGGEGGAQTGFSFRLAGVTRTNNPAWFATNPGGKNEHRMKQALHRGGTETLNFYSTSAGDYLGWAYLPDIVTKPGQAYLDGVVINWETLPGVSDTWAGRFDQGETATHEVGHWLDLEHTFDGGCNAKGDFVADTPAQKTPTSGCPAGKDTCKEPGLDPIHNYMDYSFDSCYTQFTAGQTQRMRDAWLHFRG